MHGTVFIDNPPPDSQGNGRTYRSEKRGPNVTRWKHLDSWKVGMPSLMPPLTAATKETPAPLVSGTTSNLSRGARSPRPSCPLEFAPTT